MEKLRQPIKPLKAAKFNEFANAREDQHALIIETHLQIQIIREGGLVPPKHHYGTAFQS